MSDQNYGDAGNNQSNDVNSAEDQGVNEVTAQPKVNLGQVRRAGEQSVLSVLSKVAGQQFSNTHEAAAFVEALLGQPKPTVGDAQPKSKDSGRSTGEIAELRSMINDLHSQLKQKDQAVRTASLQSQIKEVAVRTGFDPNMLDIATGLFESNIAFDESGSFYVRGANGQMRLDELGNPYTLEALAKDILKAKPKLGVDNAPTGTGTKFGFGPTAGLNEIPDASQNMEGWKQWKQQNGVGTSNFKALAVTVNKPLK